MVSKILRPGDKVEIRPVQQIEQKSKTGREAHIYKSMIEEVYDNDEIDITMPLEEGKYVLLHLGIRFEFVFYGETNLYRGIGQVKERFKSNNIYMLKIELKTPLSKFQRREYYRFPCIMDMRYYRIEDELSKIDDADEILEMIQESQPEEKEKKATILDISGGGARFVSEEKFEKDKFILMELCFITADMDKEYWVKSRVISWNKLDAPEPRYETRVEFIMKNNKVREDIIRYIFEEERRRRKNENR